MKAQLLCQVIYALGDYSVQRSYSTRQIHPTVDKVMNYTTYLSGITGRCPFLRNPTQHLRSTIIKKSPSNEIHFAISIQ